MILTYNAVCHELCILSCFTSFRLSSPCLQLCVTKLGSPRFRFPCSIESSACLTICLVTLRVCNPKMPVSLKERFIKPSLGIFLHGCGTWPVLVRHKLEPPLTEMNILASAGHILLNWNICWGGCTESSKRIV